MRLTGLGIGGRKYQPRSQNARPDSPIVNQLELFSYLPCSIECVFPDFPIFMTPPLSCPAYTTTYANQHLEPITVAIGVLVLISSPTHSDTLAGKRLDPSS